ncbi:MAG: hypothetical protein QM776_02535 [Rhodocyclaceae bacterium]
MIEDTRSMSAPGKLTQFEADIQRLIAAGDIEHALAFTRFIVDHVRHDPAATSLVLGSPALDQLCSRMGATTLAQLRQHGLPAAAEAPAEIIILATELYALGGHSRVVEDFIRAQPHKRHLLMLTDFFGSADDMALGVFRALGAEVHRAPAGPRLDKLLWTQMALARHPQAQVFLFNHHADAVAIAAVQPGLNREVLFCHHGDHNLCLGVHLPHARHIDFFAPFQHACEAKGIAAAYWPLSVPDGGARSDAPDSFCRDGLLSCSSGSWSKFAQPHGFSYAELLPQLLHITGGRHLHIGDMPDEVKAGIVAGLQARGIDPSRFRHLPRVPSLWQSLRDEGVDLYIGSFPIGGGRALIEAFGAGIPVITFRHPVSPMLGTTGLGPADSWSWAQPDELMNVLKQATPAELARRSRVARAHYLAHHAPGLLAACLAGSQQPTSPAFVTQCGDDLQAYLLRSLGRQEQIEPVLASLAEHATRLQAAASPLAQAIAHFEAGALEEAYALLLPLLDAPDVDADVLLYLGLIAQRAKLADDATVFFEHAIARSHDAAAMQARIARLQSPASAATTAAGVRPLRIAFTLARLDQHAPVARLQTLLCELDPARFETLLFIDGVADTSAAQRFVLIADVCAPCPLGDADKAAAQISKHRPDVLIAIGPTHQHLPPGLAARELHWSQIAALADTAAVELLLGTNGETPPRHSREGGNPATFATQGNDLQP